VRLSDALSAAGWGRDEDGDRRRRAEQNVVELSDGTAVAGLPEGTPLAVTEEILRRARAVEDDTIRRAVQTDLSRRARAIQDEARRMTPKRADPPVPDDDAEVPGHRLEREHHGQATIVRCECGRWDGGWLGPRSRRRVLDDHAAHVAAELAAAGPLIVPSERADQPKEIE
jgi:hypothetical protein